MTSADVIAHARDRESLRGALTIKGRDPYVSPVNRRAAHALPLPPELSPHDVSSIDRRLLARCGRSVPRVLRFFGELSAHPSKDIDLHAVHQHARGENLRHV